MAYIGELCLPLPNKKVFKTLRKLCRKANARRNWVLKNKVFMKEFDHEEETTTKDRSSSEMEASKNLYRNLSNVDKFTMENLKRKLPDVDKCLMENLETKNRQIKVMVGGPNDKTYNTMITCANANEKEVKLNSAWGWVGNTHTSSRGFENVAAQNRDSSSS